MHTLTPNTPIYPKSRLAAWFEPLPLLYATGNLDLLRLPLTALFCSRKCPGDAILKAYDLACEVRDQKTPVIGGFHTPVEKDMLEILLKGDGPVVMCLAKGLEKVHIKKGLHTKIEGSSLLLLSIHEAPRITAESSNQRNLLTAALASDHKFIHVEPGGTLSSLYQTIIEKKGDGYESR